MISARAPVVRLRKFTIYQGHNCRCDSQEAVLQIFLPRCHFWYLHCRAGDQAIYEPVGRGKHKPYVSLIKWEVVQLTLFLFLLPLLIHTYP